MSGYPLSDDVLVLIKELITNISTLREDTDMFQEINRYFVEKLQNADSMFYINHKNIDQSMESLSEKFMFHGFIREGKDLARLYDKVLCENLHKDEVQNRLNVLKLLLSLSESPTNYLASLTEAHISYKVDEEPQIDWASYLMEGIERWTPPADSDSESWSSDDDSMTSKDEFVSNSVSASISLPALDSQIEEVLVKPKSYQNIMENLLNSVQNHWFNTDFVQHLPESQHKEATVALRWHEFLCKSTHGLIDIEKPSIISEYKLVREVIWQIWEPHDSFAFKIIGNKLTIRDNRTIASVCPRAMKNFLKYFLKYIIIMNKFRKFEISVNSHVYADASQEMLPPCTYESYCVGLKQVLQPLVQKLVDLELEISQQTTLMTLLRLASFLKITFGPTETLYDVHTEIISDCRKTSAFNCATHLLATLRLGLVDCVNKQEQDIHLALYLQSLYRYMTIIDRWLGKNDFNDYRNEFVIINYQNYYGEDPLNASFMEKGQDWQMIFKVRELEGVSKSDGLLQIMSTQVLEIGKNIYLLSLLGKLHLLESNQDSNSKLSLYDELVNAVLARLAKFSPESQVDNNAAIKEIKESDAASSSDIYDMSKVHAICKDDCKYPTEMDKLENLVDTSDGFLMEAFADFFAPQQTPQDTIKVPTLYERINTLTTHMYPCGNVIEDVFLTILYERYHESGLLLKNTLINDFKLEQHLELLKRVFLFKDDFIFRFYRLIFEKMDTNTTWNNTLWLTSLLQNVFMDLHAEQYKNLTVLAKENWSETWKDPFKVCTNFNIQYKIEWPANIVIRSEHLLMYKEMFTFILQIKWALFTLNHLKFSEIESINFKLKKDPKSLQILQNRLRVLRFCLINQFSSIQHYILGFIYDNYNQEFDKNLEAACDLDSLIFAHMTFITNIHKDATFLRDINKNEHGFSLLLYLVRKLRLMWRNMKEINDAELDKCEEFYKECHKVLFKIIHPKDLF